MQLGAAISRRRASFVAAVALVASCQRDVFIGADLSSPAGFDGGAGGAGSGGSSGTPDVVGPCTPVACEGVVGACGDCRDNDGDGEIDGDDPDCLGPCHATEDNFANPHPSDQQECLQDCYFDRNSGFDDDCTWSHRCDPRAIAPDFFPAGSRCRYDPNASLPRQQTCQSTAQTQSATCGVRCLPLVPNGCDCFGCCVVAGASTPVWLGSQDDAGNPLCDLAHVADPTRCKPCTQVPSCLNPCDECERCIGKTQLPATCREGGSCPVPQCTRGTPCGDPCLPACPAGHWCITGCCVEPPR